MTAVAPRTLPTREDPLLGAVRYCRRCGEEWPLDSEFWFFDRLGYVMGHCKACWSERDRTKKKGVTA